MELEKGNLGLLRHHAKEALPKLGRNSEEGLALSLQIMVFDAHHELHERNIFKLIEFFCTSSFSVKSGT